jgi:hypothetical protein
MNIFKRSQKINSNFLFEKIMNYSKNTFDKNEMDFLQTPHPENIQDFFELYKNLSSFKKSIFFDRFKEFADNIEFREKQLKVNLFSQSLIRMCLKNIDDLIISCTDNYGFNTHLFFVLFDASEKLSMSDDFKRDIIKSYNYHTKNEIGSSAIVKPYFDMKKEEMGYGPFQKKNSL